MLVFVCLTFMLTLSSSVRASRDDFSAEGFPSSSSTASDEMFYPIRPVSNFILFFIFSSLHSFWILYGFAVLQITHASTALDTDPGVALEVFLMLYVDLLL